jgi:Na+/phosphate symporter
MLLRGLTMSDEEFDSLMEDTSLVEGVQSQDNLVENLAAVPEVILSPSKKSKRRGSDIIQHALERAEKIKADRNLENQKAKGNLHNNVSFLHFSNDDISASLQNLGIFAANKDVSLDDAINDIRSVEHERLRDHVSLNDNNDSSLIFDNDFVEDQLEDIFLLHQLCSEIMDEVMDSFSNYFRF